MIMKIKHFLPFSLLGLMCVNGCSGCQNSTGTENSTSVSKDVPKASTQSNRQEIDLGKGTAVPLAAVREEAKAPISFSDEKSFQARLKSGGIVSIAESDMVIGEPNYEKSNPQFLALDTLELKKGARIVTGGNNLVIFVNKVISEDGGVVAMTDKTINAANGAGVGARGIPGVSGGTVTIFTVNGIEGRLHVNLSGQNGGNGVKGATGQQGPPGVKGANAQMQYAIPPYCKAGGQDGQPGHKGLPGLQGGAGGNGGQGGFLAIYTIGSSPVPAASWDFTGDPGKGGTPGGGGDGGPGGVGGEGGNGEGTCGGGHGAGSGPQGDPGPTGDAGLVPAKGNSISKNVDLEFVIKSTKVIPVSH
jgi:hypothetical protein